MERRLDEFLESMVKDKSYDYIANNYMNFRKEELKDIILELLYAIHTTAHTGKEMMILADAGMELTERWDINE